MKPKNKRIASLCCNAATVVIGSTTKWYQCTKCELPCDINQISFMGSTGSTTPPPPDPIITHLNRLERMMIVESITRTLLLLVYMIGVLIFMAIP